jgi:hypothetical protein
LAIGKAEKAIKQLAEPGLVNIDFNFADGNAFGPVVGDRPIFGVMLVRPVNATRRRLEIIEQIIRRCRTICTSLSANGVVTMCRKQCADKHSFRAEKGEPRLALSYNSTYALSNMRNRLQTKCPIQRHPQQNFVANARYRALPGARIRRNQRAPTFQTHRPNE